MEDVLEVYHRPRDPRRPLVCLDETTKQLVGEVCTPIPAAPGRLEAFDYEYVRNGVGTLFMMVAPLEGWRQVRVTEQKTRIDYAHCLKWLADETFPRAEKIILVQDNLNTHQPSSLYCAFAPEEARRLMDRFEAPLHTKARQLAQHGRNRVECDAKAMSGPPHRKHGLLGKGGWDLEQRAQ